MTALAIAGAAYAEANWGRWISRCPAPWCTNAVGLDRGQARFECIGLDSCGAVADLVWPADPQAIEAVLSLRPVPRTRNWLPGESVTELVAENVAHGVLPPEWLALERGQLEIVTTADDRVVGGILLEQLVAADPRREIGA
jgi:hypothetical protein